MDGEDWDIIREEWARVWRSAEPVLFALLALMALLTLPACAYLDAAHAVKEEGKARMAILNDHYAADVADLARTIPAGALARMPAGDRKCAIAMLVGLRLVDCSFIAVPSWAREGR